MRSHREPKYSRLVRRQKKRELKRGRRSQRQVNAATRKLTGQPDPILRDLEEKMHRAYDTISRAVADQMFGAPPLLTKLKSRARKYPGGKRITELTSWDGRKYATYAKGKR